MIHSSTKPFLKDSGKPFFNDSGAPPNIDAAIEDKVAWAEACFQQRGRELAQDPDAAKLLAELGVAIERSHQTMCEIGVVRYCRACDEQDGGSCCGAELENRYDAVLLLINRLLGVRLPGRRLDARSCFFLGERGCVLKARQVICVNYLCRAITDRLDPAALAALHEREGTELEALFVLHGRITAQLNSARSFSTKV